MNPTFKQNNQPTIARSSRHAVRSESRPARAAAVVIEALEARSLLAANVTGFVLVDVPTGADIMRIEDGTVINLAALPGKKPKVAIRAELDGAAQSVQFTADGKKRKAEHGHPFALAGDRRGRYKATKLSSSARAR